MELDDRKLKILTAVIKNYLETGEPVGSRTISKYTDINLSSATIRNEMADLEELGYIVQPHTSAGRIPSDKGYRLYVDNLMARKEAELIKREEDVSRKEDLLIEKVDKVETLLKNVAKVLANNTNYATMVTKPKYNRNRLKFIQLSRVDEASVLAVIVMEGNIIKNKIINTEEDIDNEDVLKLNILLNSTLNGLTLEEINLNMLSKLKTQSFGHSELVKDVVMAISETISEEENLEIYTSGATNIFKYPELSDTSKASELICTLEEKQLLTNLVDDSADDAGGIQVYIGSETPVQSMKDCSVVTATYEIEEGVKGTIGIIGPKRMDYEKVVENLKTVKKQLDIAFNRQKSTRDKDE